MRAAASSIAKGKPSSRAQIAATSRAFAAVSSKLGVLARTRARNSAIAPYWATSSTGMDEGLRTKDERVSSAGSNWSSLVVGRSSFVVGGSASGGTAKTFSLEIRSSARLVTSS